MWVEGVGRREKYQQQKLGKIKESNGEYRMKRKTKLLINELMDIKIIVIIITNRKYN